jgi:hypothetical protein
MPGDRRICVYIVTYKKPDVLAENLRTLYAGLTEPEDVAVTVLSNHPDVVIPEGLPSQPRVVINTVRQANSWGHLSRDWNWALLDCFETWRGSRAEWCVLAQNDVTWLPGWDARLTEIRNRDFISQPVGDQAMAFRLAAVQAVGFFDERFSVLHFQEQDYFLRAISRLGSRAAINDGHLPFSDWHPTGDVITRPTSSGFDESGDGLIHTRKQYDEMQNLLLNKWGATHTWQLWDRELFRLLLRTGGLHEPDDYELYPFFWDGYVDGRWSRWSAPVYQPPTARYDFSFVVRSDEDAGELMDCLQSIADRYGEGSFEVIISAPLTPEMERIADAVAGDVRFLFRRDDSDEDVERRLECAPLSADVRTLTNRDRV